MICYVKQTKKRNKKVKNKRDMKKYVIAIAMMLTLGINVEAASQSHRHSPRTEQVDSTQNKPDAIEAFSDTTSIDSADADEDEYVTYRNSNSISDEDAQVLKEVFEGLGRIVGPGIALLIVAIVVLFLLLPLLIIIAIFYFVNRNRKEKYRLAEMAIKNGQPIPDELLKEQKSEDDWERNDYAAGMRQLFLGIGLAIFLGYAAGKIGFGIGALVFFIGLGKVIIAKTSGKKDIDINNNNLQNYD